MPRHSTGTHDRWPGLIAALALMVPAVALYLLTAPWPDTPDGLFHLHRVRALAEALRMGVLYPRWFPDFAFGYGYPVLNFYAPLFYYPPALLHLVGLDVITAVRVTLAAWYAFSGLAIYALLQRWVRPLPAALGAILYLAFPYRLYDLFVRGALPEFAAFLWPPLIAWATVKWLTRDPTEVDARYRTVTHAAAGTTADENTHRTRAFRRFLPSRGQPAKASSPDCGAAIFRADVTCGRRRTRVNENGRRSLLRSGASPGVRIFRADALILAALAWAALILTHNLTALMTALTGAGIVIFWVASVSLRRPVGIRTRSLLAPIFGSGLPLVLGTLLSGPYIAPALLETGWVGLGATPEARGYSAHFATLGNLFDFSLPYRYPVAAQPTVPLPGYVALLLLVAVGLMLLPAARGHRRGLGASIAITVGTLWLSTGSSAFVWDALAPALGKLQFPWCWQAITALAMAAVLAWTLEIGRRWLLTRRQAVVKMPTAFVATTLVASGRVERLKPSLRRFSSAPVQPTPQMASIRTRLLAWGFGLVLAIGLIFVALGGLRTTPAQLSAADLTVEQMWDFDAQHGQVGASWAGEFLPRWVTEQRWAIGREPGGDTNIV
ncbi:MAG: 6-pyruvoyl-tetrahydropterin synthase-related protein, partial [Anaerolineae bacterium]|nr:6-pyruvoyl-tetrahydropterin synthase-related protein [Anaerolineae bacterium]